MKTLDLKKDLKAFYQPSAKKVEFIQVPRFHFLMIDGAIEPGKEPGNSPLFEENMQALYGTAYTLKFMFKKRDVDPVDYPVMALEGLWDARDGKFDINIKDNWDYTLMILVPELITPAIFDEALAQMRKKKGDLPGYARLRLDSFEEGPCVQTMHIGPYATEIGNARKNAGLHARERLPGSCWQGRQAPRNLYGRSTQGSTRKAQDGLAASGLEVIC